MWDVCRCWTSQHSPKGGPFCVWTWCVKKKRSGSPQLRQGENLQLALQWSFKLQQQQQHVISWLIVVASPKVDCIVFMFSFFWSTRYICIIAFIYMYTHVYVCMIFHVLATVGVVTSKNIQTYTYVVFIVFLYLFTFYRMHTIYILYINLYNIDYMCTYIYVWMWTCISIFFCDARLYWYSNVSQLFNKANHTQPQSFLQPRHGEKDYSDLFCASGVVGIATTKPRHLRFVCLFM